MLRHLLARSCGFTPISNPLISAKPVLASKTFPLRFAFLKTQYRTEIVASADELPASNIIIRSSDFQEILREKYDVIDKTLFIKDFMSGKPEVKVTVILRPSRFGKSTNLSMLQSFFSLGADHRQFDRFLIGKDTDFVSRHCGKYPVLSLDFKECKARTWNEMLEIVWSKILFSARNFLGDLKKGRESRKLSDPRLRCFENPEPPPEVTIRSSLEILADAIYKIYGKQLILLVDEYDAPLNNAFLSGFYDQASLFWSGFLSSVLKDNDAVCKACMMGIVELRGAGILSGISNVRIYSAGSERYSQFFGFTLSEIHDFLQNDLVEKKVLEWYNGYLMGSTLVVNPWSFVCFIESRELSSYWVQSSFLETLSSVLAPHVRKLLLEAFTLLQKGGEYPLPSLSTRVDYSQQSWCPTSILHFLVLTGYLTYNSKRRVVYIPNYEVRSCWESDVLSLIRSTLRQEYGSTLRTLLLGSWSNTSGLEELMLKLLLSSSYFDLISENSYHVLYFGFFSGVFFNDEDVFVKSNRESGHGRFDIVLGFADLKKAIIFELKEAKSKEQLKSKAVEALGQIDEKNYFEDFAGYDCQLVGVSVFKKAICLHSQKRQC